MIDQASTVAPASTVDLDYLHRSLRRPRALFSFCMSVLCGALTLLVATPLFSVLFMLVWMPANDVEPVTLMLTVTAAEQMVLPA